MEEGAGISLYILVGIIIFGLFVGISILFGEGVLSSSKDIIACVESYVGDGQTGCGESDPYELPEDDLGEQDDSRIGPSELEWAELPAGSEGHWGRYNYVQQYKKALEEYKPELVDTQFYKHISNNLSQVNQGAIYGDFDEEGNLIKTYTVGNLGGVGKERHVDVNDIRLVPEHVIEQGDTYTVEGPQGYISYKYRDATGTTTYWVYPN